MVHCTQDSQWLGRKWKIFELVTVHVTDDDVEGDHQMSVEAELESTLTVSMESKLDTDPPLKYLMMCNNFH